MSLGLMPYIAYLMPTRWVVDVSKTGRCDGWRAYYFLVNANSKAGQYSVNFYFRMPHLRELLS